MGSVEIEERPTPHSAHAIAVEVSNLSKHYPLGISQFKRLRQLLAPDQNDLREGLWALRDVSFSVRRGEAFGIVGTNGSGKSTLLRMIAGVLRPTSGSVDVRGRLSALLELGSGFSPEFTGRENVFLNASLLGLSREETESRFGDIERFAGIGEFIDQPIRTYSSGMVLRLAFAVSAFVDPEILIVDEALAVGDIAFRQRCMRRIHELRANGATLLFVSHDAGDVKALCERCLWLDQGKQHLLGEADEVIAQYLSATLRREMVSAGRPADSGRRDFPQAAPDLVPGEGIISSFEGKRRHGDGRVTISGADLKNNAGATILRLEAGTQAVVRFQFRLNSAIQSPIAGFLVRNARGENIFGTNTARENIPFPLHESGLNSVSFHWAAPGLVPETYYISVAISDGNVEEYVICDYVEDAIEVDFAHAGWSGPGYMRIPCASVSIHRS